MKRLVKRLNQGLEEWEVHVHLDDWDKDARSFTVFMFARMAHMPNQGARALMAAFRVILNQWRAVEYWELESRQQENPRDRTHPPGWQYEFTLNR